MYIYVGVRTSAQWLRVIAPKVNARFYFAEKYTVAKKNKIELIKLTNNKPQKNLKNTGRSAYQNGKFFIV